MHQECDQLFQRLRRLSGLNSEHLDRHPALANLRQHLSRRSRHRLIDNHERATVLASELPAESPAVPSRGLIFFRIKCEFTRHSESSWSVGESTWSRNAAKAFAGRGEDQNGTYRTWRCSRGHCTVTTSRLQRRTQCNTNKMRAEPQLEPPRETRAAPIANEGQHGQER